MTRQILEITQQKGDYDFRAILDFLGFSYPNNVSKERDMFSCLLRMCASDLVLYDIQSPGLIEIINPGNVLYEVPYSVALNEQYYSALSQPVDALPVFFADYCNTIGGCVVIHSKVTKAVLLDHICRYLEK